MNSGKYLRALFLNDLETMSFDLEIAKQIYREAIDCSARDGEGEAWWAEVAAQVRAVVEATDVNSAANAIAWWHNDWSAPGDTPYRAARRIRSAAARAARRQ